MAFVRVTDPDMAEGMYRAGLLYEEYVELGIPSRSIVPACDWDIGAVRNQAARRRAYGYNLYIQLEE